MLKTKKFEYNNDLTFYYTSIIIYSGYFDSVYLYSASGDGNACYLDSVYLSSASGNGNARNVD